MPQAPSVRLHLGATRRSPHGGLYISAKIALHKSQRSFFVNLPVNSHFVSLARPAGDFNSGALGEP